MALRGFHVPVGNTFAWSERGDAGGAAEAALLCARRRSDRRDIEGGHHGWRHAGWMRTGNGTRCGWGMQRYTARCTGTVAAGRPGGPDGEAGDGADRSAETASPPMVAYAIAI